MLMVNLWEKKDMDSYIEAFFLYSRFLFELNQVPDFAERIFCLLFQESFQESISVIDNKLNNLKMTSEVNTIRAIISKF